MAEIVRCVGGIRKEEDVGWAGQSKGGRQCRRNGKHRRKGV